MAFPADRASVGVAVAVADPPLPRFRADSGTRGERPRPRPRPRIHQEPVEHPLGWSAREDVMRVFFHEGGGSNPIEADDVANGTLSGAQALKELPVNAGGYTDAYVS